MKDVYGKYAELLVNYSLELKKGDKVFIISSYLAEDLLKEVYREVLAAGAHPEFRIGLNGTEKIFYDNASDEQLKYSSPMFEYMIANYDALLNIVAPFNLKELQNIDQVGKVIAESIVDFASQAQTRRLIEDLRKAGLNFKHSEQRILSSKLSGKTVVFTGELKEFSRSLAEQLVRRLGGNSSSSVSKLTDFVVVGQNPGLKAAKARNLGVKIVNEEQFLRLIK